MLTNLPTWRARGLWMLAAVLLGCGPAADPDAGRALDAGRRDAGRADAGTQDAGRVDAGQPGIAAMHDRDVRGVWIATVFNINWPSRTGLSAEAQQAELIALLDAAEEAGANAVFFQARAEADAFYRSELEPFSRFLTGTQGGDPGYDPLSFVIDAAHARGLELHVWMNPYRAFASADASGTSAAHVTRAQPEIVRTYGTNHWIDPGSDAGRAHTLAVIRDVLNRYDVDGLHFDDYFYPYPAGGQAFDDDVTYSAYTAAGGTLERDDWRRDNVHQMVEAVHTLVREIRPDVRFGISPFGIYRPGMPEGIVGLDPVAELYADPLRWMTEGWVDYIAPQLYWPTTRTGQAFERLLDWWADRAMETGRWLLVGHYTAQLDSASDWSRSEFETQLALVRGARDRRTRGSIHYHLGPIVEDRSGIATYLRDTHHAEPAATPPLVDAVGPAPSPPTVSVDEADVLWSAPDERHLAAYEETDAGLRLRRLFPAGAGRGTLSRGSWVLTLIDRQGLEGRGTRVQIDAEGPVDPPPDPPPTGASCTHSFGGTYAHGACSASYQCCDGAWRMGTDVCGACVCVETSGNTGCAP
ncbi:MAG: glycoside hydrolase family 10 protein [Sandaracinaceae bacterium]